MCVQIISSQISLAFRIGVIPQLWLNIASRDFPAIPRVQLKRLFRELRVEFTVAEAQKYLLAFYTKTDRETSDNILRNDITMGARAIYSTDWKRLLFPRWRIFPGLRAIATAHWLDISVCRCHGPIENSCSFSYSCFLRGDDLQGTIRDTIASQNASRLQATSAIPFPEFVAVTGRIRTRI